jgi:hypothetical protein
VSIRKLITAFASATLAMAFMGGAAATAGAAPSPDVTEVWHQSLPIDWNGSKYLGVDSSLEPGQVDWHFVANQVSDANTMHLTATFQTAGTVEQTGYVQGNNIAWEIITPTADTLIAPDPTTDVVGSGEFNLSHTSANPIVQHDSSISTVIHQGATDEGGPFIGDLPLGSYVHDSATVTVQDGAAIPDNSKVEFTFTGGYSATYDVPASGVVDMALPKGPLHAGDYAYSAQFISGDTSLVKSSALETPERLHVNKGQLEISTVIHDVTHQDITGASVALGSTIHDTAILAHKVADFAVPAITFAMNGSDVASVDKPEAGIDAQTVDQGPLHAGTYDFVASVGSNADYDGVTVATPERVTVRKGDLVLSTKVLNAAGRDVTGQDILVGAIVHDQLFYTGQVGDFAPTGTVAYTLSSDKGASAGPEQVALGLASLPYTVASWGKYQYVAVYSGDSDYNGAALGPEPFVAYRAAFVSPGFWKSTNGLAAWAKLLAPQGITKDTEFNATAGQLPYYSGAPLAPDASLGQVLTGGAGQYGGAAYNAVGAYLTDQALKQYGWAWSGTFSGTNPIGSGGVVYPQW